MENNPQIEINPLVTFMLMAFNQEKWIREAIRAAFSQEYSPLEIIISDDGSSDETFRIIEEEVKSYSGPHKVVVNSNIVNFGIAMHLSKLVAMASGSLVVYACGDDISLPHRVRRIVDVWNEHERSSILIQSQFTSIRDDGNVLDSGFKINDELFKSVASLCETNMFVFGATSAYTKNLITDFPALLPDLVHEDCCTPFRARIIDAPVVSISESLVLYRRVGVTSEYSDSITREQARVFFKRVAIDYLQKKIDIEAKGNREFLPLIKRKYAAYFFAERCADNGYSLFSLCLDFCRIRPPFWFSIKQIVKFRLKVG